MTVNVTSTRVSVTATAGDTISSLNFPFPVFGIGDLTVSVTDSAGTVTILSPSATPSPFSVTFTNDFGTRSPGTVNLLAGTNFSWLDANDNLAEGYTLTIYRTVPLTQPTPYSDLSSFRPGALENSLDRLAFQIQDLERRVQDLEDEA